jgi:hypothetical protein
VSTALPRNAGNRRQGRTKPYPPSTDPFALALLTAVAISRTLNFLCTWAVASWLKAGASPPAR